MDTTRLIRHMVMAAVLTLIAGAAVGQVQAADKPLKAAEAGASESGLSITASGAVEDDLKHCLGRIPKDASPGQRLMAEQGCGRDQESRESLDAVPGH